MESGNGSQLGSEIPDPSVINDCLELCHEKSDLINKPTALM